jgi:Ca2+-binding RTX toxin-like protein
MSHGIQRQSGTKRHDWLIGDDDNNTLAGLGGNDRIFGFEGDDTLDGGTGNDTLNGGVGNDILIGGSGRDRLTDENGDGTLDGGAGSDFIEIANGRHTVFGGAGSDLIFLTEWSGNQDVTIDGGSGTDMLQLFAWSDGPGDIDWSKVSNVEMIRVLSNEGDAFLAVSDAMFNGTDALTIIGGRGIPNSLRYDFFFDGSAVSAGALQLVGHATGSDTLFGGAKDDILIGLDGADMLRGGGGSDIIDGGEYQDVAVFSGNLADYTIAYDSEKRIVMVTDNVGSGGTDTISNVETFRFNDLDYRVEVLGVTRIGGARNDRLRGGDGDDVLRGRGGNDELVGKLGADWLDGGAGNDKLSVTTSGLDDDDHDTVLGGDGNDEISVRGGYGLVDGGAGLNTIYVTGGTHTILGGVDSDIIYASNQAGGTVLSGAGDDFVVAYGTSLFVDGGEGDDVFRGGVSGHPNDFQFDGGEGFDTFFAYEARSVDWSRLTNIERLEVEFIDTAIFELTDAMFARQSSWIIDFSDSQDLLTPDNPPVLIDGADVTTGQLTLIGRGLTGDALTGGALDDSLSGLNGNDILEGGKGDDFIDGGKGVDGAVFSGVLANYTISYDEESKIYRVTDNVGDDGTDMLQGIEKLRFSDQVHWF